MLLAIDIGNSAIKFGVFDGEILRSKFSVPTDREFTAEALAQAAAGQLDFPLNSAIACSVVPQIEQAVLEFVTQRLGLDLLFLDNASDFGLTIKYETVSTLGTDRLVNAFAAVTKYGTPLIVCSLGTATTIDVVSDQKEYLGGVIAPGIPAIAEALPMKAINLPIVDVTKPSSVIGTSTVASIQSGIFYGYASMLDGLVARIAAEFGSPLTPKVIATGGFANLIVPECKTIDTIDENLLLDGLRLLHFSLPHKT
ncbi:MAG: type III pantothenate kinase [Acidobacteriota bacterium]